MMRGEKCIRAVSDVIISRSGIASAVWNRLEDRGILILPNMVVSSSGDHGNISCTGMASRNALCLP
jgi:hypothetical protein